MSGSLAFDIAHLLAGGLVLISLMMLFQDRLTALINVFALQAAWLAALCAGARQRDDGPRVRGRQQR